MASRTKEMKYPISSVFTASAIRSHMYQSSETMKTDDILQVELRAGVGHFWSLVSEADITTLKPLVQKMMSFFTSTYSWDSTFSTMNTIKTKQRNWLTHVHLELEPIIGRRRGTPWTSRQFITYRDEQLFILTFTPTGNFGVTNQPTAYMFLDRGRKPEYLELTHV